MTFRLEDLQKAVREDAAVRARAILQPMGGADDKVFPPTHAVGDREKRPGAKYAWEERRINGDKRSCVLLDSVQSQANRMEDVLYRLWLGRRIVLPVIDVTFGAEFPDLISINSLTAPHRIADALLRDSCLDDRLFRNTALAKSFVGASIGRLADLFRANPTSLLFGLWDSTGPTGTGLRLARNLTSEIIGVDAVVGAKSGSRIDPTGIVKSPGPDDVVFKANPETAPLEQWTLDRNLAQIQKGDPVKYGNECVREDALLAR